MICGILIDLEPLIQKSEPSKLEAMQFGSEYNLLAKKRKALT
jgi:hypothetical protein